MLVQPNASGAALALLTLSVTGDEQRFGGQPSLKPGLHLRWAFDRQRGFPWFGFYLLRRPTINGGATTQCASTYFTGLTPGTGQPPISTPLGEFTNSGSLTLTDDFAPSGRIEIDLSSTSSAAAPLCFTMDQLQPCREIRVTVGFVSDFPEFNGGSGTGSDGSNGGPGSGDGTSSSGTGTSGGGPAWRGGTGGGLDGSIADALCGCDCDTEAVLPIANRVIAVSPGVYRATFGYENRGPSLVSVPLGPRNRFFPDPGSRGQPTLLHEGHHSSVFSVTFDGRPLTWSLGENQVTVSSSDAIGTDDNDDGIGGDASGDEETTGSTDDTPPGGSTPGDGSSGDGSNDGIVCTAYRHGVPVARRVIGGRAGEVVQVSLVFESIDEVRFSRGPARLIDVCITRTADGLDTGWEPVAGLEQPILLPLHHPDYPLRPGAASESDCRAIALPRIQYDSLERWEGQAFTDFFESLVELVGGGPSKGITDFVESVSAEVDASETSRVSAQSTEQSTLNLLLGASVHPAVAQMLGLYWVDTNVLEGQSYDYALVADHTNEAAGSVATVQSRLANSDYSELDVYFRIGAVHSVPPPLAAPRAAGVYALPHAGTSRDAAGTSGLLWEVNLTPDESKIRANAPILFHVWRAALPPDVEPLSEASVSDHARVTESPLAAGRMLLEDPAIGQRVPGWPTFGLYAFDGPLPEGWYAYRVSGIDIFGRYSDLSQPAKWYATDGGTLLNEYAVRLVDDIPPPPPTDVVAWVQDPADPFLTKDTGYDAWPTEYKTQVGLRVRWVWTGKHMRQAPDLHEFRVYVTAGTVASAYVEQWSQRVAVVSPTDHVIHDDLVVSTRVDGSTVSGLSAIVAGNVATVEAGADLTKVNIDGAELRLDAALGQRTFAIIEIDPATRQVVLDGTPNLTGSSAWAIGVRARIYEVFLPNVGRPFELPLLTDRANPIRYGLVGVSASDARAHVADRRTTGPLSNRAGNEGPVGGPAAIYRVHRLLPDAAALPPLPGQRLLATRADFDGQSFFTLHWTRGADLFTHVYRALDQSLFQVDARKGFSGTPRALELGLPAVIPPEWSGPRRQAAVDKINGLDAFSDYASLSDDALRLLASLPSNVDAFIRLTRAPLGRPAPDGTVGDPDIVGPNDSANANDANYYLPSPDRGCFVDALDGRAQNRYFYRTAHVDAAQNIGPIGGATPPVYLPETRLPPTLNFTRAIGEDLAIRLHWPNRPDLGVTSYDVYRTDDVNATSDIGLMTRVATVLAGAGATQSELVDGEVQPLRDYYYRLISVSETGVTSRASELARARATRSTPALPPELLEVRHSATPSPAFRLVFTKGEDVGVMPQRRTVGARNWVTLSDWLPFDAEEFVDAAVESDTVYEYRLRGRDVSGIQTALSNVVTTGVN